MTVLMKVFEAMVLQNDGLLFFPLIGVASWLIPAGISLATQFLGKDKRGKVGYQTDPYTEKLQGAVSKFWDPSAFKLEQPGIEKQTEGAISAGLTGGTTGQLLSKLGPEAASKYYGAAKAAKQEGFAEEEAYASDIYNKAGVLTSTPGQQGLIDLKRQQGLEMDEFGQKLMYEDIQREIDATKMAEDIMQNYIGQGQYLGTTQRQAQKDPYDMMLQAMGLGKGLGGEAYEKPGPWYDPIGEMAGGVAGTQLNKWLGGLGKKKTPTTGSSGSMDIGKIIEMFTGK